VVLAAGVVTTAIGEWSIANDHVIEPDGDIVVTGVSRLESSEAAAVATIRYQADGALDLSFGDGGSITTSIGRTDDYGLAVAAYPGQRIVVAGNAYDSFFDTFDADFALARYDQHGDLDTTFGGKAKNAGKVQIDVGQDCVQHRPFHETASVQGGMDALLPALLGAGCQELGLCGGLTPREGDAAARVLIENGIPSDHIHDLIDRQPFSHHF
jgi:uncharacterized delta-60 repeat protein